MLQPFKNQPFTEFSKQENRKAFEAALHKVRSEFGRQYPLIIDGKSIQTDETMESNNPADPDEVIGVVCQADPDLADKAVRAAANRFEYWKSVDPGSRARILFRAAAILRRRRHEFSAWLVYEAGKSWEEADKDTAEAIDFLEFYGREMIRLSERQPLYRIPEEDNELYYIPLGVGAVITPWNFPLAIMVGMTCASVVAGNTVVLKPAETTNVIAAQFVKILEDAGLPPGIVQYLPGPGETVGEALVDHPLTRFICFTGSREVGLRINERAAKTHPGQKWIKRVIAEMGGKNSIIVDNDSDLEFAADAIVSSAFGFSGQKCSQCARAIVHRDVYDVVMDKVIKLAASWKVGDPADPNHQMGPVIDLTAYDKIWSYIEIGKKEGTLVLGGKKSAGKGYFIPPTIFTDVDPEARIAQEEIFGPVLAFIKANNFEHALEIANNTEYGLTGAVFSRNREHLEKARRDYHAGNLYFNRNCTGALVGVHPFGGFNMSGTDSKAGGRDYLLLLTQGKLVSERM